MGSGVRVGVSMYSNGVPDWSYLFEDVEMKLEINPDVIDTPPPREVAQGACLHIIASPIVVDVRDCG